MSTEKLSHWSLYFHHCCLLALGQYPFFYNRARRRFRTSYPMLAITVGLKLITVTVGPYASIQYLKGFHSIPSSILPVALNFIADEMYWLREVALLVLFLTNSSGFCELLNESIALEEQLLKRFQSVQPRGSSRLYVSLVVMKIIVAVNCTLYAFSVTSNGVLENAYAIINITLFMKGFYFADQFIILLQRISNGLDVLTSQLRELKADLAHVFAGYDELGYCEILNRVAIAHSKIYRQLHSVLHLFGVPMLLWLLLLYNGIVLVLFLELTYLYIMINGLEITFRDKLLGLLMFFLFCGNIQLLVHMSTTIVKKQNQLEQTIQSIAFLMPKDERVRQMVRLLWMQVKHEKFEVWFAGVVRIDHSLILAVFSSSLKFLVLLVQFQLQGDNEL